MTPADEEIAALRAEVATLQRRVASLEAERMSHSLVDELMAMDDRPVEFSRPPYMRLKSRIRDAVIERRRSEHADE